jgi:FlgD Ig-like domain
MFSNNIIYGNVGGSFGSQMIIDDPYPFAGPLYIEYNDLTSIPLENPPVILGPGNITLPPRFVDYQNGDLRLEMFSPCIDAGNPTDPLDPDGTRSDIGAIPYETNVQAVVADIDLTNLGGLRQNSPNPFRSSTQIRFNLSRAEPVNLSIVNVNGRLVADLLHGQMGAGSHEVSWNGQDAAGNRVASGVYFYRLQTSGISKVRAMVLRR